MTAALALVGVLATFAATMIGHWITRQQNLRLDSERQQSEKRLAQEHDEERARLRLDAAMRAAGLFGQSSEDPASAARSASGLLALTQLNRADLAVALLVDLWSPRRRSRRSEDDGSGKAVVHDSTSVSTETASGVSTETAIQVIDAALEAADEPNAQLIAAELLCRNAKALDICQSLHWPSSIDSCWLPGLLPTAKLLIMDALIHMALASETTQNALRSLTVRLYGVWAGDPSDRVKGCIGTLIRAILPAIRDLGYTEFMQGPGSVTLEQMEQAADSASTNPDGYLEMILEDRSRQLEQWSQRCGIVSLEPGMLATAASAL